MYVCVCTVSTLCVCVRVCLHVEGLQNEEAVEALLSTTLWAECTCEGFLDMVEVRGEVARVCV